MQIGLVLLALFTRDCQLTCCLFNHHHDHLVTWFGVRQQPSTHDRRWQQPAADQAGTKTWLHLTMSSSRSSQSRSLSSRTVLVTGADTNAQCCTAAAGKGRCTASPVCRSPDSCTKISHHPKIRDSSLGGRGNHTVVTALSLQKTKTGTKKGSGSISKLQSV